MASKPGILTHWPWTPLGGFKHLILGPWVIHSTYEMVRKGEGERDVGYFLIFPFLLFRMLHNQIWISLSRYLTSKGTSRIVDKPLEFDQVDRESNWDDQILFNGILFYVGYMLIPEATHMPWWRTDGIILTMLLHAGPVEFLYYWLHRALHHHFLYSRYHSHHHSSIVTEPITSVIHPFGEHIAYFLLFAIPLYTTTATRTASIASFVGYITYIDLMNNIGHCNFEFIPKSLFSLFPPLKYLFYTPSFHSLHHTQFRTNYSLFMPLYDYIYNTTDKFSDSLYESSLQRKEESPDVVHLTHLTTPESIYHLRIALASFASKPYSSKWYLCLAWPITCWSAVLTRIYGRTFICERNTFHNLIFQTWLLPRYNLQYLLKWQRESINTLIEQAILEADSKGVKVLSLGLHNQGEDLNKYGEAYVIRNPQLKVRIVDGTTLAVAVILNTIPKQTKQVLLTAQLTKVAYATAIALCQRGVQIATLHADELEKLRLRVDGSCRNNLVLATSYSHKIWLVGDELSEKDQLKASKGTTFIPLSQFPPKESRKDCFYHTTPAMIVPKSYENMHSCENWLPRRVMSAWRIGGIVHAVEGWEEHDCGAAISNIDKVWEATIRLGFRPLSLMEHHT